jgi:hypothetical protein
MEALKKSYKSYLVALLVVIFIGIAGGFTKTVNHTYTSAGCDTELLEETPLVCMEAQGILEDEYGTRTVFNSKSTALFAIAGAVVALVGLEVKRKKRG